MNEHAKAGRPLVGLAVILLLAGCAAGASPTPVPATPTPVATPSAAIATPGSTPSPTASPIPAAAASGCVVSTLAGKAGEAGAVDGVGTEARFSGEPQFIVMDSRGDMFVTDTADHVIRKMTPDGVVTTFAGKIGELGSVDGVGTAARFNRPNGLAIDASDTLYVAGNDADDVRKITPDGTVTTLASKLGIEPSGIALDAAGNVYTGGWVGNVLLKIAPDGTVAELAGKRGSPGSIDGTGDAARFRILLTVVADAQGVLWVADLAFDLSELAVRRVTPDGTVTTLKGDWQTYGLPSVFWVAPSGELYATAFVGQTVMRIAEDGTVTLLAGKPDEAGSVDGPGDVARFAGPIGIMRDASGLFYIVDSDNHTIRTMRCPDRAAVVVRPAPPDVMTTGRVRHTATLLEDGRVLLTGGDLVAGSEAPASAELFDPATGTFVSTGSMASIHRGGHTAIRLAGDRVLLVGGIAHFDPHWREIWDPATGRFTTPGGNGPAGQGDWSWAMAAGPLPDGRVLVRRSETSTAELFDPATGNVTPTGALLSNPRFATATLLRDGRVLVVGGGYDALVYDPATGQFTDTGSVSPGSQARTAVTLLDGHVLILGDEASDIYDPATGAVTPTGSMMTYRTGFAAVLLADGRVLVVGGDPLATAELYDPATGTFGLTGSMAVPRYGHTATLLGDGTVLIAGGGSQPGVLGGGLASAELYDPVTGTFSPLGEP